MPVVWFATCDDEGCSRYGKWTVGNPAQPAVCRKCQGLLDWEERDITPAGPAADPDLKAEDAEPANEVSTGRPKVNNGIVGEFMKRKAQHDAEIAERKRRFDSDEVLPEVNNGIVGQLLRNWYHHDEQEKEKKRRFDSGEVLPELNDGIAGQLMEPQYEHNTGEAEKKRSIDTGETLPEVKDEYDFSFVPAPKRASSPQEFPENFFDDDHFPVVETKKSAPSVSDLMSANGDEKAAEAGKAMQAEEDCQECQIENSDSLVHPSVQLFSGTTSAAPKHLL